MRRFLCGITSGIFNNGIFYDVLQDYFPTVRVYNKQKIKFLKDILSKIEFSKVLDFGCGTGNLASLFSCDNYYGLDVNQDYINRAKLKNPRFRFTCYDGIEIPFKNEDFDLIVTSNVFHHIPLDKLSKLFPQLCNLLKVNGKFICLDGLPSYYQTSLLVKFILYLDIGGVFSRTRGNK